jgi:hypothetical protein
MAPATVGGQLGVRQFREKCVALKKGHMKIGTYSIFS